MIILIYPGAKYSISDTINYCIRDRLTTSRAIQKKPNNERCKIDSYVELKDITCEQNRTIRRTFVVNEIAIKQSIDWKKKDNSVLGKLLVYQPKSHVNKLNKTFFIRTFKTKNVSNYYFFEIFKI